MRYCLAIALLSVAACNASSAFVPTPSTRGDVFQKRGLVQLDMGVKGPEKSQTNMGNKVPEKNLSSMDILNRARQAVGMPEVEEAPKLFSDAIYDDFQQSLLQLEKRVKDGAGSLTSDALKDFEARTQRIVDEMKEFLATGRSSAHQDGTSSAAPEGPPKETSPPPPAAKVSPETDPSTQPTEALKSSGYGVTDKSDDEGPAYDGKGGMGVAKGTRNTYVIPGMDEMSPEEYRAALQKSVSDRQTRRRGSQGGVVGNRAALQYLDQIGWGGAASNWESKNEEEDEDK